MNAIRQITEGKQTVLYPAQAENMPLMIFNHFSTDTDSVVEAFRNMKSRDYLNHQDSLKHPDMSYQPDGSDINLLFVCGLDWEHDMTPWESPPIRKGEKPFSGGADGYLEILLTKIMPKAGEMMNGVPAYTAIAGYSLAGLFAIYSMFNCDAFDRAASISGSMWFPGFTEYVLSHEVKKNPDRIYMSLGDKECKTRDPRLKTVQDKTRAMVRHFKNKGIPVTWELNPGNHFTDPAGRCARGIISLTR